MTRRTLLLFLPGFFAGLFFTPTEDIHPLFRGLRIIPGPNLPQARYVTSMYGGASDPFWKNRWLPVCGFVSRPIRQGSLRD